MKSLKSYRSLYYSLSGRLVLLFVVMSLLLVVLIGISIGSAFRSHFTDTVRPHLLRYMEYVQKDIGTPPDRDRAQQLASELAVDISILEQAGQWSTSGSAIDPGSLHLHSWRRHNSTEYAFGFIEDQEYLIARFPDYTLAFAAKRTQNGFHWRVVPLALLIIMLFLLFHATKKLISPIHTIRTGIQRIGTGELAHRIEIKRKDELGELASSINAMAGDIGQLLEAKRQLLLAISHELRSPLTRAKVASELLADYEPRREIQNDLLEMEKLIEELLETERLSSRHQALNLSTFSLTELANDLIEDTFPNGHLIVERPDSDIQIEADSARLRLLLKNLLDNALRYTLDQADPPVLTIERMGNQVSIRVRDFGAGIDANHLPHLTEPFYRADPARRRETGGYGLGLYLCRMIAEAHKGALRIKSKIGEGTEVEVRIASSSATT